MHFTITQPAGLNTRFGPTAFDALVGTRVPFQVGERSPFADGILIAAVVSPDGSSAELTFEVEPTTPVPDLGNLLGGRGMSFGWHD